MANIELRVRGQRLLVNRGYVVALNGALPDNKGSTQ